MKPLAFACKPSWTMQPLFDLNKIAMMAFPEKKVA
jgi:hypothetical protein